MAELKPCPFCGGVAVWINFGDEWSLGCNGEGCSIIPETGWFQTQQEAIDAWNRRSET